MPQKDHQILSYSGNMSTESILDKTKTKAMIEEEISADRNAKTGQCKNINGSNPGKSNIFGYKRSISLQSAKKKDQKGIIKIVLQIKRIHRCIYIVILCVYVYTEIIIE